MHGWGRYFVDEWSTIIDAAVKESLKTDVIHALKRDIKTIKAKVTQQLLDS